MTEASIYKDIATRTGGEIYIGVAGPVRTGKSTFIKRFMDTLVLPHMTDTFAAERARDELPQSAAGKTVMTTEPKFIPNDAAAVKLDDGTSFNVKMIDCVGYIVPDALGLTEDEKPRMVMTPWSDEPVPFEQAAETGTRKVIREHSTVGLLITTDGSFTDIPRESYETAERRAAEEMKDTGKPFVILLNTAEPSGEQAKSLAHSLHTKYNVPVKCVNCLDMTEQDISGIIKDLLYEFPISTLTFTVPAWVSTLSPSHPLRTTVTEGIRERAGTISRLSGISEAFENVTEGEFGTSIFLDGINPSDGSARLSVDVPRSLFYSILSDETGLTIGGDEDLADIVTSLAASKSKFAKFEKALEQVEATGYGIVTPDAEDMTLEEPEIIKQAGSYGVKLRACAPSIHMIRYKPKFLETA